MLRHLLQHVVADGARRRQVAHEAAARDERLEQRLGGPAVRPRGAGLCGGQHDVLHACPGTRHTCLAPDRLPRLAMGRPSISMMSSAKDSTGALAIEVPTP